MIPRREDQFQSIMNILILIYLFIFFLQDIRNFHWNYSAILYDSSFRIYPKVRKLSIKIIIQGTNRLNRPGMRFRDINTRNIASKLK